MTIAGETSTGSKRPRALFGTASAALPQRMQSARGAIVHADGRDYLDFVMGLGAVALGYGHPEVTTAIIDAARRGAVGPLPPTDEDALAADLTAIMPQLEMVRFLKSGAEAMAAAVRIARVATRRDRILGCGYHGWLDWCSDAAGVPAATRALYTALPFNDIDTAVRTIRAAGSELAAVIIEPVIEAEPDRAWLDALRSESAATGALLIFDEVKTAFRVAAGGAVDRWGVGPDLTVIGKALANGLPLAAVGGSQAIMQHVEETWISSTAATEFISLAAARATLQAFTREHVAAHIAAGGQRLIAGLTHLAGLHRGISVRGIAEMCYLHYDDPDRSARVAAGCARRGLLFKRTAYNFVSLAHDNDAIDWALATLQEALAEC